MASGWMKSLQCKSRAYQDVYQPHSKYLIPTSTCTNTAQNVRDVVIDTTKPKPKSKPKPKPKPKPFQKQPSSRYPSTTAKPDIEITINRSRSVTATATRHADPRFPSLTELTEGHPSRNVVGIIFHTSWGPKPFSGRVEMIFKVHNGPRTVSRFEEYREAVKGRTSPAHDYEENARCLADGNEVMRFHCLGPTTGATYGGTSALSFLGLKGSAICTFSGSEVAHASSGGGRSRRAMMLCRVIAGRVSKQIGFMESLLDGPAGFDSVSGDNGQLLVFDSRAVLPCFLIIYKL